jgi:hypothetical protein
VVPLGAIRQFLEDPLQGSARFRLRMREIEGDEELVDRVDEPFETDRLTRTIVLKEAMLRALLAGEAAPTWARVEAELGQQLLRAELAGLVPTGFLGAAERPGHEAVLRGWLEDVVTVSGERPLGARLLQFGRASTGAGAGAESRDPIVLAVEGPDGRPVRAELVGRTELCIGPAAAPATLLLVCRKRSADKPARRQRDWLRAFVDHMALAAAGLATSARDVLVAVAGGGEHALDRARLLPVTTETARAYLGEIVREMLTGARDAGGAATGVHPYLLPCEAVFEARPDGGSVVDVVERLRDNYFQNERWSFSSVVGPVPQAVERHQPPPADEAAAMAEARFGLYFELLEVADKPKGRSRR